MHSTNSDVAKIGAGVEKLFDDYTFTYVAAWDTSTLPVQRCSDDTYIPDELVVDYYRNLDYHMIEYIDYPSKVIEGMVKYSFWLVTSFSEQGMKSPMNMYSEQHYTNIHPGKKRYIVANYMGLDSVPVLVQQLKHEDRIDGTPIHNIDQLIDLYGNNVSVKVVHNYNQDVLECSWHGATNLRDANDYDGWWAIASQSINHTNRILEYILEEGLHVQSSTSDLVINNSNDNYVTKVHPNARDRQFFLEVPDSAYLDYDLWKLYFHFDPRVGIKECTETGIRIVNKFGDPNWKIQVNLAKTLQRPWLEYVNE
jgi:hypothetical protein